MSGNLFGQKCDYACLYLEEKCTRDLENIVKIKQMRSKGNTAEVIREIKKNFPSYKNISVTDLDRTIEEISEKFLKKCEEVHQGINGIKSTKISQK